MESDNCRAFIVDVTEVEPADFQSSAPYWATLAIVVDRDGKKCRCAANNAFARGGKPYQWSARERVSARVTEFKLGAPSTSRGSVEERYVVASVVASFSETETWALKSAGMFFKRVAVLSDEALCFDVAQAHPAQITNSY